MLALDRLYTATERWKELAETLRGEIRLADADDEVVALQFRLGQTLEQPLDDKRGAIDVYREILTSTPTHAPSPRSAIRQHQLPRSSSVMPARPSKT